MKILSYRYLPLNIYLGYSFFVLVCLFLGPIEYKDLDYLVLVAFIAVLIFLFALGYLVGAQGNYLKYSIRFEERFFAYQRIRRFLSILLTLGVISSAIQWYSFLAHSGGLNLGNIGHSYVETYEGYVRGQAHVDIYYVLNIFDQALVVLVLLLSFYYFRVMGASAKYAFLFIVATYLLINVVGTGKQKYLGDIVIYTFFCMMINFAAKGRKFKMQALGIVAMAAILVFLMFMEILRQRYQAVGIGLDNISEKVHPLIIWDDNALLLDLVDDNYALALSMFLMYLTNGLYGLYLSLTLPFEWSYFVGNSYSLGRIVEMAVSSGGAILEHTYPYRVGVIYGWGFDKWHSLFAWLASDITFLGVLFVAPLFAFFYAKLWLQAIRAINPFSGPLFVYLSLGLIFSYANNQIMHTAAGVIVLLILLTGWMFFKNLAG